MPTIFTLTVSLLALGVLLHQFRDRRFHQTLSRLVEPLINKLTQLASLGVQVMCGMGLVAVLTGAVHHAPLIGLFLLYFIAMMEVTTSFWRSQGLSKATPFLLSILMCAPWVARIL